MSTNEKILDALKSAKTSLENSITALHKKDENAFANGLWHVAAELEYANFLFSIKLQDESETSKWKPNPELKKVEVEPVLVEVQNLIHEAETSALSEKPLDAYRSSYVARYYVSKVQEDLAKKKSEALKKK